MRAVWWRSSCRAQSGGEAVVHIEQHLGDVEAGIAQADAALGLGLFHELIVGVLKQTFEVDQMLKIFQMLHLFFIEFLFSGVLPALP